MQRSVFGVRISFGLRFSVFLFAVRNPGVGQDPQPWLRRFNSAFAPLLGCKHCSDAADF
jgi:hypothetical protein